MNPAPESCAVAFLSQRNNATFETSATAGATVHQQIARKPASIRELHAQLVAQQERNSAASVRATGGLEVAHEVAALTAANALALEFMDVDGMTLEDATALAAQCAPPRAAWEWESMLRELDTLIDEACNRSGLSQEAQARIIASRNRQSLASIPNTLQWF